jgi:hypothetical protein
VNLRRWDIVFVPADDKDRVGHPAVVLSHEGRLADPRMERINVLMGTKKQPAESAREHQVVLNGADGLEFLTLLDCAFIYAARKSAILRSAGTVGFHRRQEIQRKVRAYLGLG